jgi:LacI family transcriptional regulator
MPQITAINQRLIAERLNLSPATVSKSFRNHPDIKPETRALVLDLASKMGYRSSLGRRADKKRSARFIGVLFFDDGANPDLDTAGHGFLTGLSAAAPVRDASLIVHRFGPDSKQILDPAHQPPALRDGLIDGLILVHRIDPDAVRTLATALPTVVLTHSVANVRTDVVDSDHISGMAKLMDHLYSMGHRQIGYVGRSRQLAYSQARFGSYCQSICRLELGNKDRWLSNVFNDVDFDQQADWAVQAIGDGVTAFVCANDNVGYQLCRRLMDRRVRVPEDVSITGFDAMQPILGCPKLTTLRVPFAEMGAAALDRLLARIERADLPALQTLFDCQWMEGQTIGPARTRSAIH